MESYVNCVYGLHFQLVFILYLFHLFCSLSVTLFLFSLLNVFPFQMNQMSQHGYLYTLFITCGLNRQLDLHLLQNVCSPQQ